MTREQTVTVVRRLLIVSGSAALHVGSAGLALMLAGVGGASPVFIDLATDLTGEVIQEARADLSPRPRPAGATPRRRVTASSVAAAPDVSRAASVSMAMPGPGEERPQAPPSASPPAPPSSPVSTSAEPSPALVVADTPPATAAPPAGAPTPDGEQSATGGTGAGDVLGRGNPTGRPGSGTAGSLGSGMGSAGQPRGVGDGSALAATTSEGRDGTAAEYGPYLAGFRRRIQEALEYPLAARRRGLSGTVELEVLLDPSGRVTAARVVSSSSHAVLDDAALRAVRGLGAEPFPERLPRKSLRIRIPLAFELR